MSIFTSFNVNASGMTAQRYRMDIISENVANMNTTRTEDGTPYRRKVVTFEEKGPKQGTFSSIFGTGRSVFHRGLLPQSGYLQRESDRSPVPVEGDDQ